MQVMARRPGTYSGHERDFGQVFILPSGPRNEQLLRLGYLQEWQGSPVACGECGRTFTGSADREAHGRKRHAGKRVSMIKNLDDLTGPELEHVLREREQCSLAERGFVGDSEVDAMEREDARLEERAPLFLENTAASRK